MDYGLGWALTKEQPVKDSVVIAEVQLLLAEKRTSLSVLRTGITVLILPLSVMSFLIATEKSDIFARLNFRDFWNWNYSVWLNIHIKCVTYKAIDNNNHFLQAFSFKKTERLRIKRK